MNAAVAPCTCGKLPKVFKSQHGYYYIRCECGINSPLSRDRELIVTYWNRVHGRADDETDG